MTDPIPKFLRAGPKPSEEPEVDGWLRAALKRCWPRLEFTPVHERPWSPISYKVIALHVDLTTPRGLR